MRDLKACGWLFNARCFLFRNASSCVHIQTRGVRWSLNCSAPCYFVLMQMWEVWGNSKHKGWHLFLWETYFSSTRRRLAILARCSNFAICEISKENEDSIFCETTTDGRTDGQTGRHYDHDFFNHLDSKFKSLRPSKSIKTKFFVFFNKLFSHKSVYGVTYIFYMNGICRQALKLALHLNCKLYKYFIKHVWFLQWNIWLFLIAHYELHCYSFLVSIHYFRMNLL